MESSQKCIINEYHLWNDINKLNTSIPDNNKELMPGIKWGCFSRLYTPAYWKMQYFLHNQEDNHCINYKLGDNVLEEVVACLLGGFGMKSELGLAAFTRLKNRRLIIAGVDFISILNSLSEPFFLGFKMVHYRFPNQKAKFITEFLNRKDLNRIPIHCDLTFRNWLLSINGIGPKTASWITRNFLDSENVAIIDVHILRAGIIVGLFSRHLDLQKDYFKLEKTFIQFCNALEVRPSKMDALMWLQMKESNRTAINLINNL